MGRYGSSMMEQKVHFKWTATPLFQTTDTINVTQKTQIPVAQNYN